MTLLTLFLLGTIAIFIEIGIDLNKQLRAYERKEKERKTLNRVKANLKNTSKHKF